MKRRRIATYATNLLRCLGRVRARDLLRACAGSPLVIKRLERHGFSIVLDVRDPAISRPIAVIEEYERHVTEALLALLSSRTCFLDIGANIGFFTLLAASHCPAGRVLSFEPDPENVKLLRASVALNGFEGRVVVHPYAVSDNDETLSLSDLGDRHNLGARFTAKDPGLLKARAPNGTSLVQVRAVCLDRFLVEERVDLVKVDIEGYEPYAFKGMAGILRRDRPTVITEFAPGTIEHITQTDPRDLLRLFGELGYAMSIIAPGKGLVPAGDDPEAIMKYYGEQRTHHIDLLLKPK